MMVKEPAAPPVQEANSRLDSHGLVAEFRQRECRWLDPVRCQRQEQRRAESTELPRRRFIATRWKRSGLRRIKFLRLATHQGWFPDASRAAWGRPGGADTPAAPHQPVSSKASRCRAGNDGLTSRRD